jgi:hypothetical protein
MNQDKELLKILERQGQYESIIEIFSTKSKRIE